jgi:Zn-dependent peptidase ImmA (M78 family)
MSVNEQVARRTANELLDELKITVAPIDPEWIARAKQLMFEDTDGFPVEIYGALFRSGNQFGILVSSACPGDGHRRFTIAHELGHYHLPGHVERLFPFDGDGNAVSMGGHFRGRKDPVEVEADYFASELLMPERLVRPLIRRIGDGLNAIQVLAGEFRTSMSAAAIRYASVTNEAVAVILSRDGVIEWTAISPALFAHRWARPSLKKEWAPRGSGTRRLALGPDRVRNGESDGATMLLCEWFPGAPAPIGVAEEAIGLGAFGRVLTVLTAVDLSDPRYEGDGEEDPDDGRTGDWRDALRGYRMG